MKLARTTLFVIVIFTCVAEAGTSTNGEHSGIAEGRHSVAPTAVFPGSGTGGIADGTGPGPADWGAPLDIIFDVTGLVGPIRNIVLSVTMTHTYVGDLEAVLYAPGGQGSLVIFSRIGATDATSLGDSSNFSGTYTYADFATANPWTVATSPTCGVTCIVTPRDYRTTIAGPTANPAQLTSLRNGFSHIAFPNGFWTLRIRDGAQMDTGSVTAASLTIETLYSKAPFDFDGDDKTDIGIYRPGPAEWWINSSLNGSTSAFQFGTTTDKIVPADFSGDGKTDAAFWRPSNGFWYVLRSEDFSFYAFPFGISGDIPVPADFDDDGRADAAVFRASNSRWYVQQSTGGVTLQFFGSPGDVPVVADYDLDGRADVAIFRPSTGQWWIRRSSAGGFSYVVRFGASGDIPVQGDYTGDGRADVAFWRPSNGNWFIMRWEDLTFYAVPFGISTDIPAPGDYDGDGRHDPTVFRPSTATWYSNRSTAGALIQQFGANGDRPVPNAFVP